MKKTWTIQLAQKMLARWEEKLKDHRLHVALAGSVLYRGWSENDLDVFIYTHQAPTITPISERADEIFGALGVEAQKLNYKSDSRGHSTDYPEDRDIYLVEKDGWKINIFLIGF